MPPSPKAIRPPACRSHARSAVIHDYQPLDRAALQKSKAQVLLQFGLLAGALAACFVAGQASGRRSAAGSGAPLPADVNAKTLEFTVPSDLLREEGLQAESLLQSKVEAPPRELRLKIDLPLPVRIRPPNEQRQTRKDAMLMAGSSPLDKAAVRTKYSQHVHWLGCYKMSPFDKARQARKDQEGKYMETLFDYACMEAKGATADDPCASGLPFYRMLMQKHQTHTDCLLFCISKGLDIYGIVRHKNLRTEFQEVVDFAAHECRCGASERNTAIWKRGLDRRKMLNEKDQVKFRDPECAVFTWVYSGPMPEGAVPFQLLMENVQDEGYVDSIASGEMAMAQEEDVQWQETVPARLELDANFKEIAYTPGATRRLEQREEANAPKRRLGVCIDEEETHVSISGVPATCAMLKPLCRDETTSGVAVRAACPVACGMCEHGDWLPCYPYQCASAPPWPTKASDGLVYIPFYFDATVDQMRAKAFRMAALEFQAKTCIRFSEQPDGQRPITRVTVGDKTLCNASMGYPGDDGEAEVNMGWCATSTHVPTLIHVLGHIIGMGHEQERPDAQRAVKTKHGVFGPHIKIFWDNIDPKYKAKWEPVETTYMGSNDQGTSGGAEEDLWHGYSPYDYESIMHYGRFASNPKGPAFGTVNPIWNSVVGQRNALSKGDVRQITDMYQCSWMGASEKEDLSMMENGKRGTQGGTVPAGQSCENRDPPGWQCNGSPCTCEALSSYCQHSIYSSDIQKYCPQTCGHCDSECKDTMPKEWKCNGKDCSCSALAGFCRDPYYGPMLTMSCRATCRAC